MLHGLQLRNLGVELVNVALVLLQTRHDHLLLVADVLVQLAQLRTPLEFGFMMFFFDDMG